MLVAVQVWALCAAMSASAPDSVEALERLAPQAGWARTPLQGLDAQLVVLPTKVPNRFVIKRGRVAEATLEAAAPLFAPLDALSAERLVAALDGAELVQPEALSRLRAAGFSVADTKLAVPRGPFLFNRLELRSAQSEPSVVTVRLALDEQGRVERYQQVVARLPPPVGAGAPVESAVAPAARGAQVDRSDEIARFVSAARGR